MTDSSDNRTTTICGKTCKHYSKGNCSKALSDSLDTINTIRHSLYDMMKHSQTFKEIGHNLTLHESVLLLAQHATENEYWDRAEWLHEVSTDESACGCLAKYPTSTILS